MSARMDGQQRRESAAQIGRPIGCTVLGNHWTANSTGAQPSLIRMAVSNANLIGLGDKFGAIYLVRANGQHVRQWKAVLRLDAVPTCLAFVDNECSDSCECNLIVGTTRAVNRIHFIDICSESLSARLLATIESTHKTAINRITCSLDRRAMTSSPYDRALVWDLSSLRSTKQLIDRKCAQCLFWSSDRIITSYRNPNVVHVSDAHTFQVLLTLTDRELISVHNHHMVTRMGSGREAVTGCSKHVWQQQHQSLEVHAIDFRHNRIRSQSVDANDQSLDARKVRQTICLSDGSRALIHRTSDGLLYSRDVALDCTGSTFTTIAANHELLVGLTTGGRIHVFDCTELRAENARQNQKESEAETERRAETERKRVQKLSQVLLNKYRKFPQKYRFFIWSQLLAIPHNTHSFRVLRKEAQNMSAEVKSALDQLSQRYALIDSDLAQALNATIARLVYWRPELLSGHSVDSLALFCFPFVKLWLRNQFLVFEVLATLLDNNFFLDKHLRSTQPELFAVTAQLLRQESSALDRHFKKLDLDFTDCCQPLVLTIFSEVFLRDDWLTVCDHLLTFGPQMNVYLMVSFCCRSDRTLLRMQSSEQIRQYFRSQNSMSVSQVIELAHSLAKKYVPLKAYDFVPLSQHLYY